MPSQSVTKPNEIPIGTHYAICTAALIPADYELGKYPTGEDRNLIAYQAFTDRVEWEIEVQRLTGLGEPFTAMEVRPARVTINIKVDVENLPAVTAKTDTPFDLGF